MTGTLPDFRRYPLGDGCLCWQLGDSIDRQVSIRILFLYRHLKFLVESGGIQALDVVPAYHSLAVHFDPSKVHPDDIVLRVEAAIRDLPEEIDVVPGKPHVLMVVYVGPDLPRVADHCGLSLPEVISLHCNVAYHVAMIGFKPHFPYLLGLDPRLATPRLATPRTHVPAGSVAIGGAQTGIYPCDSPGGWNIIGAMDPEKLRSIEPGDVIRFQPVQK